MPVSQTEFGPELRRRRSDRGMSLTALAAAVHCSPGYLSRIERGQRRPTSLLARLCDQQLSADGSLVALFRPGRSRPAPDRSPDPAPASASFLVRSFEQAASAAVVLNDDLASTADGARAVFEALRAQGHTSDPRALLPALAIQFGVLRAAAKQSTGPVRQRLRILAAHYAEYAGWMIQECGDPAGALALTDVAAELSGRAGEQSFVAYAMLRRADLAHGRGDGAAVVALAGQVTGGPPGLRALAAQRAAQGWALLGRERECRAALDRAAAAAAEATEIGTGAGLSLGSGGGGRLMDVVRGWCYLDLGRPEQAAEALRSGLARAPRTARRAHGLYGMRLALAHAAQGQVPEALTAGAAALDAAAQVSSAAVRQQARTLAGVVRRWPGGKTTRDFRIRLDREL